MSGEPRLFSFAPTEVPVRQSWLSPLAVCHEAGAKGKGVFAVAPIPAGTTVAGFGGNVVDRAELDALDEETRVHALQIDEDLFIASAPPFDDADYVNHSCDPNCGIVGAVLLVALRDVAAGEALCFDYAMTDSDDYDEFTCMCDTAICRGTVTGADWKEPELCDRYPGWRSAYIAGRGTYL
jgi:SET domain-containing protein